MNILIHVFSELYTFVFDTYLRVVLVNYWKCACFTLVEKCHIIFQSGCNSFHSHQQSWRVSFAPYTCWILSVFLHLLRWPCTHKIYFSINLLMWWITLLIFLMKKEPLFPGINPTWSRRTNCMLLDFMCYGFCRVFTSVFISGVGLYLRGEVALITFFFFSQNERKWPQRTRCI